MTVRESGFRWSTKDFPSEALSGSSTEKQPIVEPHLDIDCMLRRHPVHRRLHLAAVRRVASARRGIVGAAQLHDLSGAVLHDFVAGDEIGAAKPHLPARRQPEELLRRIFPEIIPFDEELA
jgi:hypothetical protein